MHSAVPGDPLDLRKAFGQYATGVAIVSACAADGRPVGITVNSFGSVSLSPPIVLWSLNSTSPSLAAFDASGRFVIHVLAVDQLELSRRFASRVPERFAGVDHRPGLGGMPVIDGCAAAFECRTVQRHEVGDHILFLGLVEAYSHRPSTGLLYCQGQYAKGVGLHRDAA